MRAHPRLLALLLLPSAACVVHLWPESADPAREAEERERDACPIAPEYPPGLFDPRNTRDVEPLYATVQSGRSGEAVHLIGVTLRVHLPLGTTSENVASLLTCHNARRELRREGEPAPVDDPYWVPGRRLTISTEFEKGILRVLVRTDDFETAKELLRRATAFQKAGLST